MSVVPVPPWALVAVLILLTPQVANGDFLYVKSLRVPTQSGDGGATSPFSRIQQAVDASVPYDIIRVMPSVHVTESVEVGGAQHLVFRSEGDDTVELKGAAFSISAAADVTFRRVSLFNCSVALEGGAKVTLVDLDARGSRIEQRGGTLQIIRVHFCSHATPRSPPSRGPKTSKAKPPLPVDPGPMNIPRFGGYIFSSEPVMASSNSSLLLLRNCTLEGGRAEQGGALYVASGRVSIMHTRFLGNEAIGNGGGLSVVGGDVTIERCMFWGNSAHRGGGVFSQNTPTLDLKSTIFESNSAAQGGGMFVLSRLALVESPTSCSFIGCSFLLNTASADGGGLLLASFASPTIQDCTFTSNHAGGGGGGVRLEMDATPSFKSCNFTGNSATDGGGFSLSDASGGTFTACELLSNTATRGGALHLSDSAQGQWLGGSVRYNTAQLEGAAFFMEGETAPSFNLTHFAWNTCYYGGSFLQGPTSHPRFNHCSVWPRVETLSNSNQHTSTVPADGSRASLVP